MKVELATRDSEDIAAHAERSLECILSGSALQRAPALRRLLIYLWEHRGESPTEYSVGVDVMGKRPDFDPKLDASVRVHISRLRQKLKEFFEHEGRSFPVHLVIPAGGLQLEVQEARMPSELALPVPAKAPARNRRLLAAMAALGGMTFIALTAAVHYRSQAVSFREQLARPSQKTELAPFWVRALLNGKPTRVVFPTPIFLRSGELRVRDVRINSADDLAESAQLKAIFGHKNAPALIQTYSVTSDTLALAMIVKMLTSAGVNVDVSAARDLSIELQGAGNLVFLGIPHTSSHVDTLLAHTNFYFTSGETVVHVRNPIPGEPAVIFQPQLAGSTGVLGIIARLPGQVPGSHLIVLSGSQTSALASYLTSPITLRELGSFLRSKGNPEFFELVLACKVEGFHLLNAKPADFRIVPASLWK